jgi:hypothetical protein
MCTEKITAPVDMVPRESSLSHQPVRSRVNRAEIVFSGVVEVICAILLAAIWHSSPEVTAMQTQFYGFLIGAFIGLIIVTFLWLVPNWKSLSAASPEHRKERKALWIQTAILMTGVTLSFALTGISLL